MSLSEEFITLTEVSRADKEPALKIPMSDVFDVKACDDERELEIAHIKAKDSTAWNALPVKKREELSNPKNALKDPPGIEIARLKYYCNERDRFICELKHYIN